MKLAGHGKKVLSLVLAAAMTVSLGTTALADDSTPTADSQTEVQQEQTVEEVPEQVPAEEEAQDGEAVSSSAEKPIETPSVSEEEPEEAETEPEETLLEAEQLEAATFATGEEPATTKAYPSSPVRIGEQEYESLSAALSTVGTEPVTIDFTGDVYEEEQIKLDGNKTVTLNLNGYTLHATRGAGSAGTESNGMQLLSGCTVTINNGTLTSEIALNGWMIKNYCDLTLNNVVVDAGNFVEGGINHCGAVLTLNNCTMTNSKGGKYAVQCGNYHTADTITVINGGSYSGVANETGYWNSDGTGVKNNIKTTIRNATVDKIGTVPYAPFYDQSVMTVESTAKVGSVEGYTARVETEGAVHYYASVHAAVQDAPSGAVVKLQQDTKEDVVIPADKTLTLDLNGHTLTNVSGHTITNNGSLTVIGEGTVDNITHSKGAFYNNVGATATLNGGTYIRSKENGITAENNGGNSWYAIKNFGTMTINEDVAVQFTGAYSSLIANGWQNYNAAVSGSGEPKPTEGVTAKLTIQGGTFSGGLNTIKNDDNGELIITGGTFENVEQYAVMNWNVATISGGTFSINGGKGYACVWTGAANDQIDQGKLTLTDGKFSAPSSASCVLASNEGIPYTVAVSGGYYTNPVNSEYIVEGKACNLLSEKYEGVYGYQVGEQVDTKVDIDVSVAEPAVDESGKIEVDDNVTKEDVIHAAKNIDVAPESKVDVMIAAKNQATLDGHKLDTDETLEKAKEELGKKNVELAGAEVTILVEPKLSITPKSGALNSMTFDIELVYDIKATTDPDNQVLPEEATGNQKVNTVYLAEDIKLPNPPAMNITLDDVSAAKISNEDGAYVFVKHTHEGAVHYYKPSEVQSGTAYVKSVTFHNPDGFSEFTLLLNKEEAQIQIKDTNVQATLTLDCVNKALPSYEKPGYTFQGLQFENVPDFTGTYSVLSEELLTALAKAYGDGTKGPVMAIAVFTKNASGSGSGSSGSTTTTNNNTPANTQSGPEIEYYTCPACGYHNWTATATGYKCDHCGYVESTKQLSSYGNVKGVYDPQSAAQASATVAQGAIPQTSDDMPLVGLAVVAIAALLGLGVTVVMKKRNMQ